MVTRTSSRATSLFALLVVALLLVTACSDDSADESTTETTLADDATTTTVAAEEPPSESPAASLRSDLTALLEEQVYLTGFTVEAAVADGGDIEAPEPAALAVATEESSGELAEIIGAAYGVAGGTEFLEAWDAHQAAVVAVGLDGAPAEDVDLARGVVIDTLADLDPEADFTGVEVGLAESDDELVITVQDMAAGTEGAAIELRTAADVMPEVALELAEIIAEHSATEGEVDSPEAALRADLTGLLQESALLTGLALSEIVQAEGDPAAPGPAGVLAALDENTAALAATMEPDDVGGEAAFVAVWGDHIDAFVDYTTALLDDDAAGIARAEQAIVEFRDEVGELVSGSYPTLSKEAVAEELVPHTDSILAYADARVAEAGGAEPIESAALLREAALAMRLTARTFAGGLSAPVT